jgi:deoxyadenosine/deoxycytidine kinase
MNLSALLQNNFDEFFSTIYNNAVGPRNTCYRNYFKMITVKTTFEIQTSAIDNHHSKSGSIKILFSMLNLLQEYPAMLYDI